MQTAQLGQLSVMSPVDLLPQPDSVPISQSIQPHPDSRQQPATLCLASLKLALEMACSGGQRALLVRDGLLTIATLSMGARAGSGKGRSLWSDELKQARAEREARYAEDRLNRKEV